MQNNYYSFYSCRDARSENSWYSFVYESSCSNW